MDNRTANAIRLFQLRRGLPVNGMVSPELLEHCRRPVELLLCLTPRKYRIKARRWRPFRAPALAWDCRSVAVLDCFCFFTGIGMTEGQSLAVALAYGGLMLSFLGGIRWGVALGQRRQRAREMIGGTAPVLLGLATFFLAPPIGLSLIIIALFIQALADVMSADRGALPLWFGRLGHSSPCSPSSR